MKKQTIALCMIVKDEAAVITRAFDSVKDFVDYFCICDTGSTDGTQGIIKDYLYTHGLEGEVHERPWVDFSHNRQEAFDLGRGKCDYIMTIDADEVFAPFVDKQAVLTKRITRLPTLNADRIDVNTCYGGILYKRTQFFKDGLNWKWNWPVHEVCSASEEGSVEIITDACIVPSPDGSRSKESHRYHKDALLYENWLLDNPKDARAWFYLAQSYRDAGQLNHAVSPLLKTVEHSRWDEEIYMSHLRMARYRRERGDSFSKALPHYWDAYNVKPERSEALYDMLLYYREKKQYSLAILIGETALKNPYPSHCKLFLERDVYTWRVREELATCYYRVGRYKEAEGLVKELLANKESVIPVSEFERIVNNFNSLQEHLHEGV